MLLRFLTWPDRMLARLSVKLIRLYQKTVSPDHSSLGKTQPFTGCKFYPSCSQYAVQVLEQKGFLFAVPVIIWRLVRCHPWSEGGIDHPKP